MKIVVLGSHGTGKTTLTRQLFNYLKEEYEMKKVGVTGSHGTGKTTLSMLLAGRLNWRYLPEAPFQAKLAGFSINEETSLVAEWWIIAKQLESELNTPEPWVADKCLIDTLAYADYLFSDNKDFLEVAREIIKPNIKYDIVFYLPSGEFPIVDDGFRPLDPDFQKKIDKLILAIMSEMNISYYKIVGNPEERFSKAKAIIQQKLKV